MSADRLLIYDGDCGFCTQMANWYAMRADSAARVEMWQALDLAGFGLDESRVSSAVQWWDGRTATAGSDGIALAMQAVPGRWRFTGHLLALPGVRHLARLAYPVIARNRHRLPGATNACRIDLNQPS